MSSVPGIYRDFVIHGISIQSNLIVICFLSGQTELNEAPFLPSKHSCLAMVLTLMEITIRRWSKENVMSEIETKRQIAQKMEKAISWLHMNSSKSSLNSTVHQGGAPDMETLV